MKKKREKRKGATRRATGACGAARVEKSTKGWMAAQWMAACAAAAAGATAMLVTSWCSPSGRVRVLASSPNCAARASTSARSAWYCGTSRVAWKDPWQAAVGG